MKNILVILFLLSFSIFSQTIVNVGFGPVWPAGLKASNKKTALNATVEYGKVFDEIIGIGADFDFMWNINDSMSAVSDSVSQKQKNDRTFMFPLSAFLFVDPIPQYKLHPVVKGQFGLNMMVRDVKDVDTTQTDETKFIKSIKNGFYIGIIGKFSADAVLDLGEHAAIFVGFEFQLGKLRHKITSGVNKGKYTYFNPNGPALRGGLSFLF